MRPTARRCALLACMLAAALAVPAAAAAAGPARARFLAHHSDPATPGLRRHAFARAADAAQWCGAETARDDGPDQVQNGSFRFHAVYLLPASGTDRFGELATKIQADALGASGLLERLYDRAVRFDMGTGCGPGNLDISVVRTRVSARRFAEAASEQEALGLVASALRRAGFATLRSGATRHAAASLRTNYVVWLDTPAPDSGCGTADVIGDASRTRANWNNYGGKVALLLRVGDGFCGEATVRHEIGHTLGALQAGAPHAFDGQHCDDAFEDTMCYPDSPVRSSDQFENEYFDYGNDDYWDPPGGAPLAWWTVDLSRFLCPTAACNGGLS